jgi:long-chain acyl-CoA synthetase
MNAFDYFFEHTKHLDKNFLVGKEEISFTHLYQNSLSLAAWIKAKVGENKHILLLSANNLFFLKAYLAIIKSGNICIPLDPSIETENFRYISNLTNPELIFLTRDVEKKLHTGSENTIFPDTLPTENTGTRFESNFDKERCAEIIFTSGSTGKPKGVMISHKNLIANTSSIVEYLKLTQDDRMLVVLPFYYCYGLSLLHTHLRAGGSIVFNNSFIFLGGILKNLLDYKCTGFAGVPSHFQILLRKSDSFKQTKFPDLKYVTQAGGKLAPVFIDEFREAHPETRFIVMYGQTEATARLSWLPPELYESKRGSMGRGIPGVELKVINEKGERIKPGETGEVVARGENIMMGYFQDEEGTKNAIRDGWLFTGDLGTVDDEDYIYLLPDRKKSSKLAEKGSVPRKLKQLYSRSPKLLTAQSRVLRIRSREKP